MSARKLRLTIVFVTLALATFLAPSAASASTQATPDPGIYNLLNDFRDLACLAGRSDGHVTTFECRPEFGDQFWSLEPLPLAGFYRLRNQQSGKCVAMPNGSNGARATMFPCTDSFDDQWFRLDPTLAADAFMLFNHKTGKCLVARSSHGDATVSNCVLSFRDQWWHFFRRG